METERIVKYSKVPKARERALRALAHLQRNEDWITVRELLLDPTFAEASKDCRYLEANELAVRQGHAQILESIIKLSLSAGEILNGKGT